MSTLLKPAVRATTDWKAAARILPPVPIGPSVLLLSHSKAAKSTVPTTHRTTEPQMVMVAWTVQRA